MLPSNCAAAIDPKIGKNSYENIWRLCLSSRDNIISKKSVLFINSPFFLINDLYWRFDATDVSVHSISLLIRYGSEPKYHILHACSSYLHTSYTAHGTLTAMNLSKDATSQALL